MTAEIHLVVPDEASDYRPAPGWPTYADLFLAIAEICNTRGKASVIARGIIDAAVKATERT